MSIIKLHSFINKLHYTPHAQPLGGGGGGMFHVWLLHESDNIKHQFRVLCEPPALDCIQTVS